MRLLLAGLFIVQLVPLSACGKSGAQGLYGPDPVAQNVKGSRRQKLTRFETKHPSDRALAAAEEALLLQGLDVNEKRPNMVAGSGLWVSARDYHSRYASAIYVESLAANKTRVTILVDRLGGGMGGPAQTEELMRKLINNMKAVLLSGAA